MDLWPDATLDVDTSGIWKTLEVLENQRTQSVGLNSLERCDVVEARLAKQRRRYEVACSFCTARLLDEA